MKTRNLLVVLILPLSVFAQTKQSQEHLAEDYAIFKEILIKGHPSLYAYTPKEKWDSLFNYFEETALKQTTNSNDLFKSLSALADYAKDGHLIVHHPKMDTIPKMFPLLLKIIDGKLYTDKEELEIPVGSQILSIDGKEDIQLINSMLKYAPSDGYNLTKKYRQIETEFGMLHYYEFGEKSTYKIKYLTPDKQTKTVVFKSQEFEQIGKRHALRNSHFAAYHNFDNRINYFQTSIQEKWPYIYSTDSINTVVLTINSFGLDPREFKSRLVELFKEIRKKKTKNLIIDVRANNGGYRINAIHLYSFLTEKPFKLRVSESTITDILPEEEHVLHTMSSYSEFFEDYFASSKKENNRWIINEDHAQAEMIPNKKTFKGKVCVLVGGRTFSAASAFALSAKNDDEIVLVGEETGGGYYFHIGQYPVLYRLPNSKIMVRMSLIRIDKYVRDHSVSKGSGILPDIEVSLTVQDLIAGKDSQLNYVLKHIQRMK